MSASRYKKRPRRRKKWLRAVQVAVGLLCAAGLLSGLPGAAELLGQVFPGAGGAASHPSVTSAPAIHLTEPRPGSTPAAEPFAPASAPADGKLRVHILDVGQADCILVQGPEKTLVIDGGEAQNASGIIEYLRAQGVEGIDYYLNTHPHADHYGGILQVMQAIPTRAFCSHPVPEELTPTLASYERLLVYLAEQKTAGTLALLALEPGDVLDLGGGAALTVLGPVGSYPDLNNNSLVCRLDFGEASFLFTGDAEAKSEKDLLAAGARVDADVYSLPHHGSSTGVTEDFLAAVSPRYATISVGKDNDYGHPSRQTLERLQEAGAVLLRTDLVGTIVFETDGGEPAVSTQRDTSGTEDKEGF